jgi:hypothetical protein
MISFYWNGLKKIFSVAKKVFLVLAVFIAVITLFSRFISRDKVSLSLSQTDPIKQNRAEIYKIINDKELNKTQQGKLTVVLYRGMMCNMIGEACTNNPADADKNYQKSVFGFISKLIVLPYANPPASGVMWAYSGLQNAGFVPKTMAAEGIGFATIAPFANIWKIFRDLSYMLLVLVLIGIGFMIMFRMKMNPQTVISVENALPRIVIALILITFSFAIAGFLIDLMYISIVLIISVLSNGNQYYNATEYQNKYLASNLWGLITSTAVGYNIFGPSGIAPIIGNAILGIIDPTIVLIFRSLVGAITVIALNGLMNNGFINPIGSSLNNIIGILLGEGGSLGKLPGAVLVPSFFIILMAIIWWIASFALFDLLMYLFIGGTILFVAFRIFAILFSSYLKLILFTIISPFLLIFEAVPGKNIFSSWLKNIFGNLIAFPITIAIFLLGYIIVNSTLPAGYYNMRLPFLFGINSNSFKILVGMGLIFLIPDIIKLTKEALGIKDVPLNIGIGTFFGGAAAVGGGAMGLVGQYGSLMLGAQYLPVVGPWLSGKIKPPANIAKPLEDVTGQAEKSKIPPGGVKTS